MSKAIVASLLLSAALLCDAAHAAPTTGRRENPALPLATAGVFAVAGVNTGVGYVAEIAPPADITAMKLMGDHLLNQPKGAYKFGACRIRVALRHRSEAHSLGGDVDRWRL